MSLYLVTAVGCDDYTTVPVNLTGLETAAVQRVVDAVTAAGGGCHPTMTLRVAKPCPGCADGAFVPAYVGDECGTCDGAGAVPA